MNPKRFFRELRRRNIYRAAVGYAAAAWLLIQIATQTLPFFETPAWAVRLIIVLLLAGFPFALVWAWMFELTSGGIVRTEDVPPETAITRASGRKIDFLIICVLTLAIAVLVFDRFRSKVRQERSNAGEKSIAVLPFDNFSEDKEKAFFADGIQDDILTSLAKIRDLKVISRTSVMRYKGAEKTNIREIAKALGAANILEGSVRGSGNRVKVSVQLLDALADHHLWAESYDRTISDALTLQGELATEIAEKLRATLTPAEKARVQTKPTENADAYVLYLRARQYETGPDTLLQDYKTAEQLYTSALALDPDFALAHARLATTRGAIFHYYEPTDAWKTKLLAGAQEALRLQPDLGEGHVALGLYHYWIERDYDRALEEFRLALQTLPNDGNVRSLMAAIQRRQGKWPEAAKSYEQVEEVDPQNANIVRNLLFTYTAMRRWPEAERAAERLRALAPDSTNSRIQAAYVDFWARGSTTALKTTLAQIPPGVDPDGNVTAGRWDVAMIERDFAAAEQSLVASPLEGVSYLNGQMTAKTFLQGCIALAKGDSAQAQASFQSAVPGFEAAVQESPDDATRHANLGLLSAFLGRKETAMEEGRRAVELMPESKDAFDGAIMNSVLALIYARVGEADLALRLLERLIKTPGVVDSALYSVTLNDLRARWVWDPLRNEPRFQQLIAGEGN